MRSITKLGMCSNMNTLVVYNWIDKVLLRMHEYIRKGKVVGGVRSQVVGGVR